MVGSNHWIFTKTPSCKYTTVFYSLSFYMHPNNAVYISPFLLFFGCYLNLCLYFLLLLSSLYTFFLKDSIFVHGTNYHILIYILNLHLLKFRVIHPTSPWVSLIGCALAILNSACSKLSKAFLLLLNPNLYISHVPFLSKWHIHLSECLSL